MLHCSSIATSCRFCDPHGVASDGVRANEEQWGPRTGEEWFATADDERTEVEVVFVNQPECSGAAGQCRYRNSDLTVELRLKRAHEDAGVLSDQCGVRTDRLERTR